MDARVIIHRRYILRIIFHDGDVTLGHGMLWKDLYEWMNDLVQPKMSPSISLSGT